MLQNNSAQTAAEPGIPQSHADSSKNKNELMNLWTRPKGRWQNFAIRADDKYILMTIPLNDNTNLWGRRTPLQLV